MQGMDWRFGVHQKIIQVWWDLHRERFVKMESIQNPMDLNTAHQRSEELKRTLLRFEYPDWLKGYGGGYGAWDDEGLRGQFDDPVTWLAVSILRSDARRESAAKVVNWIEEQGTFDVLREEETEEEEIGPDPEYGWIDEDGMGFNDDEEVDDAREKEKQHERIGDLVELLLTETGHYPHPRIGLIVPHGQNLQVWR